MSKDPNTKAPPQESTPTSLEDAVYRSSLSEGNNGVKKASPLVTIPATVLTYAVFGAALFFVAKNSQTVQKAVKKTVGIDLAEQKEEDAPPPPPPPPPAPAAPVAPPRAVERDAPPPPPLTNQDVVPEIAPRELPKQDLSLAYAGSSSAAGNGQVAGAGVAGPTTQGGMSVAGSGSSGHVVDVDFSQVKVKRQPPAPPYPPLAKIARIQGTVVVEITVGVDGVPVSARALEGPPQLRDAAVAYAMQWRFEPCLVGGVPQQARFRLVMPFKLR
ncbi:MAG TPA: TonB family protein [Holophaga sp.]|jgi:protein TonB|nr:TonB family protein [Holophaga sp.]